MDDEDYDIDARENVLLLAVSVPPVNIVLTCSTPNRNNPSRIGMVFYQHENLHFSDHGANKEMLQVGCLLNWSDIRLASNLKGSYNGVFQTYLYCFFLYRKLCL